MKMTISSLYSRFLRSEGISTDTRGDVKDTLFFALKGDRFDGNAYVEEALAKGCRLAVTERKELEGKPGIVVVPSVLDQLQQLARYHRRQVDPEVLAITGSNGKTTTKELTAAVLSGKHSVLATGGNLNNHIGVPLTLLALRDEKIAVVEMGANHPGEISLLCSLAEPDLGLITNVGSAHLEGFGSPEGVLAAKGELYAYLASSGGKAFVDGRDLTLMGKAEEAGVSTLVIGGQGDIPISGRVVAQTPCLEVELEIDGQKYLVTSSLVGSYNLQNILLAAGVGYHFGVPPAMIIEAIAGYTPENMRSQLVEGTRNQLIMDAYNANPTSMREAIGGLLSHAGRPVMLILGDMAELGESAVEAHASLAGWINGLPAARVLLVGELFSSVADPDSRMEVFPDVSGLESFLERTKPEGYLVLVKGSRVMGLERISGLL